MRSAKVMHISLADIEEAGPRLVSGEQPYEFKTSDPAFCVSGPACGFGAGYLQGRREKGLYADNLEEAQAIASARGLTITGVWFVTSPA
jgi:hypothetical protein